MTLNDSEGDQGQAPGKMLMVTVIKCRNRLPGDAEEFLSLEAFEVAFPRHLLGMIQGKLNLPKAEVRLR